MPATVTNTRRHLNASTSFEDFKAQSVHRTYHEHDGVTSRRVYETQIERSCPAASSPNKETGCHIATDIVVVLDPPALVVARSFASPASPYQRDRVPSQVCCAPRRQTIELPLSEGPVEKLIFQWDRSLNLKAPEGEGALGLLL